MGYVFGPVNRVLSVVFIAGFLAACSDECPPAGARKAVRDVPFFLAHPEEMKAKVAACGDNPGGTFLDPECLNARSAESRRAFDPANTGMPKIRVP